MPEDPAALVPMALVAVTWKVYAVPFARFVMVVAVVEPLTTVAVCAVVPTYGVTV